MGALYLALLFQPSGRRSQLAGSAVGDEWMGSLAGRCNGVTAVRRRAAPVGAVPGHVAARDRDERVYGPRHPGAGVGRHCRCDSPSGTYRAILRHRDRCNQIR